MMQGTMPGSHKRGRSHTAWMDNISMWTGLPAEESVRMTEINGESMSMVWPPSDRGWLKNNSCVSEMIMDSTAKLLWNSDRRSRVIQSNGDIADDFGTFCDLRKQMKLISATGKLF